MEKPSLNFQNLGFNLLTAEALINVNPESVFNINVGIMGHVDSGKTSFCRFISQIASTASLDKNPQSKERGITLDIGFTSFYIEVTEAQAKAIGTDKRVIQFTLVDCPGHASFIKSVIAGASIIDSMILIVDVQKGIQVQTAECLALGEILCLPITIVLNKVDIFSKEEVNDQNGPLQKLKKTINNLIQKTNFPNKNHLKIVSHSISMSENEK